MSTLAPALTEPRLKHASGRPMDVRRKMYAVRYGISPATNARRFLPPLLLDQLDACKDEAARRLILGIAR